MAIKELPQRAASSIVSSSSVFSPVSAVKELLDNALDAGSTNIVIETDGFEYISCKDNGSGVQVNDRDLLVLQSTTSKITELDDINISGTLGFRGEALYFINQLCTGMDILTKSGSDSVGEKLVIGRDGKVSSRSKQAMERGTTIVVKGMFKKLPVRHKLMKKHVSKTMESVKKLVCSYAILYTDVRFQVKVVTVSPLGLVKVSSVPLVMNAGTALSKIQLLTGVKDDKQFICDKGSIGSGIGMFILPITKAENDIASYSKQLKIVSVNKRLLSTTLGLGKKLNMMINSLYKEFGLLNPNVWLVEMDLDCGNIDVNIEPEKNDVMVSNMDALMVELEGLIRGFLDKITEKETAGTVEQRSVLVGSTEASKRDSVQEAGEEAAEGTQLLKKTINEDAEQGQSEKETIAEATASGQLVKEAITKDTVDGQSATGSTAFYQVPQPVFDDAVTPLRTRSEKESTSTEIETSKVAPMKNYVSTPSKGIESAFKTPETRVHHMPQTRSSEYTTPQSSRSITQETIPTQPEISLGSAKSPLFVYDEPVVQAKDILQNDTTIEDALAIKKPYLDPHIIPHSRRKPTQQEEDELLALREPSPPRKKHRGDPKPVENAGKRKLDKFSEFTQSYSIVCEVKLESYTDPKTDIVEAVEGILHSHGFNTKIDSQSKEWNIITL